MRLFYASDIHGSDVCWRKFLNAGKFYRADALIMGGDIIGKAIVPIELIAGGGARATLFGKTVELASEAEIEALEKRVRDIGMYPYRAEKSELDALGESDARRQLLFEEVVRKELRRWMRVAEERHNPSISVFLMPGNDDPWFIDEMIGESNAYVFCDNRVVELDGMELLSVSYANLTPWDSPRELEEAALFDRISGLADALRAPERSIFNLHVPPFGSGLDDAPKLDHSLRPVTRMGQVELVPVGSHAVRRAIEQFQPLVSLHGHIHESRGTAQIGRTLAVNPGSDYSSGRLDGSIVEIKNGRVKSHQFVSG